jgi:hypothetical protein
MLTEHERKVMAVTMYLRQHHFPNTYATAAEA